MGVRGARIDLQVTLASSGQFPGIANGLAQRDNQAGIPVVLGGEKEKLSGIGQVGELEPAQLALGAPALRQMIRKEADILT